MLEEMAAFFEARLEGYDQHMLMAIQSAQEFYPYTASLLPPQAGARVLDLGCGTGLELEEYYRINPEAQMTGIDLSAGMLRELQRKFPNKPITLIQGSYFDVPLGQETYDAAVSVESLHHFSMERKTELYRRLHQALKPGGYLILTDYFALSEEEERNAPRELERLKAMQSLPADGLYHHDTPLTVPHELEALRLGGFQTAEVLAGWGATFTIRAKKAGRQADSRR